MKLNFRKYGEGTPLIILHGVFGSADNWLTIGRELANDFQVYLVDQRNHGLSPHSDEFNYQVMVEDLKELLDDEKIDRTVLLGHSMGGKTAMNFAVKYPEMVEKLIVVDIGPKLYPPHHEQIFKGFRSVMLDQIESRKEADQQLSANIPNMGVRQFILKNLTRDDNGRFRWKINLDAIEKNATEIGKALKDFDRFDGETLFLGGGSSDYILESDHDQIKSHFGQARFKSIEGAGHWVHAEKPKETYEIVKEFLK